MIRPIDGNDRIRLKLPFMSGALIGCYVPYFADPRRSGRREP
jgi:hypothetical protein